MGKKIQIIFSLIKLLEWSVLNVITDDRPPFHPPRTKKIKKKKQERNWPPSLHKNKSVQHSNKRLAAGEAVKAPGFKNSVQHSNKQF